MSATCKAKASRHKNDATFENRMGGSNQFCELWSWETSCKVTPKHEFSYYTASCPEVENKCVAIAEMEATNTYFCTKTRLNRIRKEKNGLAIFQPNRSILEWDKTGLLPYNESEEEAALCHIIPGLKVNLISIGQFCNVGYKAMFEKDMCKIFNDKGTIYEGEQDHKTGMWLIKIKNKLPKTQVPPYENLCVQT
mgnify:CR=1 FL=1